MDQSSGRVESVRRAVAVVTVLVTLYYLTWRYTETFNPAALAFSWALFCAEVFGFVTTALFYFTVWRPRTREAPPPLPGRSVDVFIPTKDEPLPVLRTTLLACNDLKYPHRTLVLDDGDRREVEALCGELGCAYLARQSGEHAKAGNLNHGLRHSTAEFVAVFDADHVPLPQFLDRLIGYFADERVGFVQVPQEFYNIDSIQHRIDRKQRTIWAEQHLFFSVIQPGKDAWGAAMFVGSCAILRRQALDAIGGFATGSITEDMLTSIRLHARGWSSVYHREHLAYGIAAQTLRPFSSQRQRWGVGNWQVFVRANPIFLKGLTLPQRLCYLASMIYPLEGLQKLTFYATPPIVLFTGVLPMDALDVDYLLHFVPYFLLSTFGFNELARGVGGQALLEQYSMAKYFTYLKTMVIPLAPRRARVFKVTPKTEGVQSPPRLVLPQFLVLAVGVTSILWALGALLLEHRHDGFVIAVNCFWALYNSGLAIATVEFDYRKLFQRRSEFRIPDTFPALYRPAGDAAAPRMAVADDLTDEGVSLLAVGQVPVGGRFEVSLLLPKRTLQVACQAVRERTASIGRYAVSRIGLRFVDTAQETRDLLARYLHEAAVTRFLKDYAFGYRTYLERRLGAAAAPAARAARCLAYLPVTVDGQPAGEYAVLKDLSDSGCLLVSQREWPPGSKLALDVVLGGERVPLRGVVVRSQAQPNRDYPEYLSGVRLEQPSAMQVSLLTGIANQMEAFVHGDRTNG